MGKIQNRKLDSWAAGRCAGTAGRRLSSHRVVLDYWAAGRYAGTAGWTFSFRRLVLTWCFFSSPHYSPLAN
jgi:hypothetical protein